MASFPHHYLARPQTSALDPLSRSQTPYIGSANTPTFGNSVQKPLPSSWYSGNDHTPTQNQPPPPVPPQQDRLDISSAPPDMGVEERKRRAQQQQRQKTENEEEEDEEDEEEEDEEDEEEEEEEEPTRSKRKEVKKVLMKKKGKKGPRTKKGKAKVQEEEEEEEGEEEESSDDSDNERGTDTPRQRMHRSLDEKLYMLQRKGYKLSDGFDIRTATRLQKRHEIVKGEDEVKTDLWVGTSKKVISTVAGLASLAVTQLKGEVNKYEPNIDETKLRQVYQGGLGPLEAFTDPKWSVAMEFIHPWVMNQMREAIQTVTSVTMQRMLNEKKREEMLSRPFASSPFTPSPPPNLPHGSYYPQPQPLPSRYTPAPSTPSIPFPSPSPPTPHSRPPTPSSSVVPSPTISTSSSPSPAATSSSQVPSSSPQPSYTPLTQSNRRRRSRNALLHPAMLPPEHVRPPDGFRHYRPLRAPIVFPLRHGGRS